MLHCKRVKVVLRLLSNISSLFTCVGFTRERLKERLKQAAVVLKFKLLCGLLIFSLSVSCNQRSYETHTRIVHIVEEIDFLFSSVI